MKSSRLSDIGSLACEKSSEVLERGEEVSICKTRLGQRKEIKKNKETSLFCSVEKPNSQSVFWYCPISERNERNLTTISTFDWL